MHLLIDGREGTGWSKETGRGNNHFESFGTEC